MGPLAWFHACIDFDSVLYVLVLLVQTFGSVADSWVLSHDFDNVTRTDLLVSDAVALGVVTTKGGVRWGSADKTGDRGRFPDLKKRSFLHLYVPTAESR